MVLDYHPYPTGGRVVDDRLDPLHGSGDAFLLVNAGPRLAREDPHASPPRSRGQLDHHVNQLLHLSHGPLPRPRTRVYEVRRGAHHRELDPDVVGKRPEALERGDVLACEETRVQLDSFQPEAGGPADEVLDRNAFAGDELVKKTFGEGRKPRTRAPGAISRWWCAHMSNTDFSTSRAAMARKASSHCSRR